jgi:hypothetical protein
MLNTSITAILNEKDVENFYRQYLTKKFGDIVFNSPFGCDGYGESKKHNIRLLCEFKDNLDLTSKLNQVKVLSQALYYIKKFEISGKPLPSVILIGDRNECFVIHTNEIFNYLGMNFNWSIAPSNAHTNVELVSLMIEDSRINPHVFNIKDIADCVDKIKDLTDGVKRYIPITPHNVTEVFKYFEDNVIGSHKLDTNQMANLFVQLLVNPDDNYLHPVVRRKTVVTKAFNEVNVKSREAFQSFFSHFSREYTPQQREHLTAVVDRLVQDTTRRKQGEFFTPTIWVDKAHEYIASVYGDDWKEKYVVWDPAWGTGNLTRDYKFKELYVSTLNYSDIQTANQMGYNPEATKFQFDFLNDDYDFLPQGLKTAIESGKQIIVLMNPPYGTENDLRNLKNEETIIKKNNISSVHKTMLEIKMGKGQKNMFTQFMFRIVNLNSKVHIATFSPMLFMSGSDYKLFRDFFYEKYSYEKGFIMNAKNFDDVSDWGLSFSIWSKDNQIKHDLNFSVLEFNGDEYGITKINDKKIISFSEENSMKKWTKSKIKKVVENDCVTLSSALSVKQYNNKRDINSFGEFLNSGNNTYFNNREVFIGTTKMMSGNNRSYPIKSDNFYNVTSAFASRKLIQPTWYNQKDEYFIPNENNNSYVNFKFDSVIISIFNNSSQQSSLRQIEYNGQNWDIKNEFFWMSKNEMTELANQNNYTELYNDSRTDSDRYVHTLLFGEENIYNQLSDEAKDVLDSATNLVKLSFGMRRNFADDTNHLNSWDAGYAQLKLLWKEYYPEQFKEFRTKYKVLEDKMRPMVYELGFLLK